MKTELLTQCHINFSLVSSPVIVSLKAYPKSYRRFLALSLYLLLNAHTCFSYVSCFGSYLYCLVYGQPSENFGKGKGQNLQTDSQKHKILYPFYIITLFSISVTFLSSNYKVNVFIYRVNASSFTGEKEMKRKPCRSLYQKFQGRKSCIVHRLISS